jgi:hypothetical protein
VNESIGREILHKAWREIRSPPSTQKIVAESTHEEAERNTLKRLRSQSCRRQKHLKNSKKFFQIHERLLQKVETSKDLVKFFQIRERLLQRAETFKEFMKFFQIHERFTNFLPQEKLFAEATKNMLKEQRTSRRSRKIGPTNRSEALIELRKDEERAEKEKDFQPSDLGARINIR